jgi:hypothetical protein
MKFSAQVKNDAFRPVREIIKGGKPLTLRLGGWFDIAGIRTGLTCVTILKECQE